jgi:signal transduction histidine kinase/ActR/RegA family two-component response regulator
MSREAEFRRISQVFQSPNTTHDLEQELVERLPALRSSGDKELLAHVLMSLGTRYLFGGARDQALPFISEGLSVVDPVAHSGVYLGLLNLRGICSDFERDVVGACEVYAAMIRSARESNVQRYILVGHENLAYTFMELGDHDGALELLDAVEELSRSLGPSWRARWLVARHATLTQDQRFECAQRLHPELDALLADPETGDQRCRSLYRIHQSEIDTQPGTPIPLLLDTQRAVRDLLDHPSCGLPETRARLRWLLARTARLLGDCSEAISQTTMGIELIANSPYFNLGSQLYEERAFARRASGDQEGGWADLQQSAHIAREVMHGSVGRTLRATVDRLHSELSHLKQVEAANINKALRQANSALDLAREEAESARQAAEAAAETRERFLSSMSHELRTPLNGVLGSVDLLMRTTLDAEQSELVEILKHSAALTLKIVEDVLELGRLERGDALLDLRPFDLPNLLRVTESIMRAPATRRGLRLVFDLHPHLPAQVVGDERRLHQILLNLSSNAVRYTDEGSVVVRAHPLHNDVIRFEVVDTGPGIAEAEQERIFDIYERTEATHVSNPDGTGLGLAICRNLAGLLGGTIGVTSTVGLGSTFWVELPLPRCSVPQPTQANMDATLRLDGLNILVAEDNNVNQMIIARTIRSLGGRVTIVDNGLSAVDALSEAGWSLGLVDLYMPMLGGLDVARQLRASGIDIPLVALTASATLADEQQARAAGMDGFATKPIEREALARIIHRALRTRP